MKLSVIFKRVSLPAVALLAACSGGSGEQTKTSDAVPDAGVNKAIVYAGPPANDETVASFKLNVWDNLAGDDRCGACHNEEVGQEPLYLRRDDINLAYTLSAPLMEGELAADARLVTKVAEGHQCWTDQASVCAEIIAGYIETFRSDTGEASENEVVLTAPQEKTVGASLKFPETATVFEQTLWPLLTAAETGCADCHSETGSRQRQQPYFASSVVETAYLAAQSKINLNDAAALREPVQAGAPRPTSRLLVRLRDEGHNCWTDPDGVSDCAYSADEMETAITAFLNGLDEPIGLSDGLMAVASRAVNLVEDGVIASSGGRVETNVIALYEFKLGSGSTAFDYSGVSPELNLNLSGDVDWVGSWGLRFNGGTATGSSSASNKLSERLKRTGEFSVEAWVIPANVSQDGSARIVTYSGSATERNFTLGQTMYNYDFLSRSSNVEQTELLATADADEVLQATLQHVVVNYHPVDGRSIFVNGEPVAEDAPDAGTLNDWDDIYVLSLGGEVGGLETWQGTVRLLAIHERALTQEQITNNYDAGVGQKYFLLFGVSHLVDMPEAYVVFEVEVFDDYSYLFNSPFFISLDSTATVPEGGIRLQGMRLGLNGNEVALGQAFANMDFTVTSSNYVAQSGVSLASVGTVIASEQGQDLDEFFLTFDQIGSAEFARAAPATAQSEVLPLADQQSTFGVRNFGEINATLASITTVPATTPSVVAIYDAVIQQLPQVEDVNGFLPAHQAGVMQLAVAYCNELVSDSGLRASYFPGFNFAGTITAGNQDLIVDPLVAKMLVGDIAGGFNRSLNNQPSLTDSGDISDPDNKGVRTLLNELITGVAADDTEKAVIAACTALAGSAVMLMQ